MGRGFRFWWGGVAMEDARLAELLVRGLAASIRPDARWYTRTILGPDVRQRLLMGAVCPWGACGGQGSSCAKPHSLTNSVQVRRKRTGANILRAPPRRSAKLQQCGPTFETVLHGGYAVRGVNALVTLDAISHAGSGVGAVRPGRLSIAWVVGEG